MVEWRDLRTINLIAIFFFSTLLLQGCSCSRTSLTNEKSPSQVEPRSKVNADSPFGFLSSFYHQDRTNYPYTGATSRKDFSQEHPHDSPYYSTAIDVGSRWERLSHPAIDWDIVQEDSTAISQKTYDWSISDNFINDVPQDLELVVNIYAGTNRFEKGTWQLKNEDAYLEFVRSAIERYDGDGVNDMPGLRKPILYWQIENEPSVRALSRSDCSGVQCYESSYQDPQGFAHLLNITYEAIKEGNPEITVLSAGTVQGDSIDQTVFESFWSPLLNEVAADSSKKYFDLFDIHWFSDWKSFADQYNRYRDKLDAIGYTNTPIWMTENGSPSTPNDEEWQAVDHVRRFIYPLGLGVKKIFRAWALVEGWPPFDCRNDTMFETTGLIYDGHCDDDEGYGVKKLGYYTYKLLAHELNATGWDQVSLEKADSGGLFLVRFPKSDGSTSYVAWIDSTDDSEVQTHTISVAKGTTATYSVTVPTASSGSDLNANEYPNFFETGTLTIDQGSFSIDLTTKAKLIHILP